MIFHVFHMRDLLGFEAWGVFVWIWISIGLFECGNETFVNVGAYSITVCEILSHQSTFYRGNQMKANYNIIFEMIKNQLFLNVYQIFLDITLIVNDNRYAWLQFWLKQKAVVLEILDVKNWTFCVLICNKNMSIVADITNVNNWPILHIVLLIS